MATKLPTLPKLVPQARLTPLRTPGRIPTGPEIVKPASAKPFGGPGEPPPGFVSATTSTYEWWVYWALAKIFKHPENPRVGPFIGGPPEWIYQKNVEGGRHRPGGAVIDFIVYDHGRGGKPLAIRVVTEAFHLFTDSTQQAIDAMQKEAVEDYATVVDILDYQFIGDPTGQAVVITVKNALGLLESANPLLAGTAIRGSRLG